MNNSVIGLDIAKDIFHMYTSDEKKSKPVKKKLKRAELLIFFANYPVSLIGIEACGGAHHWARELTKQGHEVILLNARYVKGFVVGNKNDFFVITTSLAGRLFGESLFLRKLVLGIPAQASSKNLTRPLMPPAAPIRPRHLVPTQQGVGT